VTSYEMCLPVVWYRFHDVNADNQLDATIKFINNSNYLNMFRAMVSHETC